MSTRIEKLGIVGVGLIGGGVAKAARQRRLATRIVGVDSNTSHLAAAQALGLADETSHDIAALAECELVVVAVPPRVALQVIGAVLDVTRAIVTDTTSVKAFLARALDGHADRARLVLAHPMAGTSGTGPEEASADLFQGRPVLIEEAVGSGLIAAEFWQNLGAHLVPVRDWVEHDAWMAKVSHAPHAIAFALAATVLPDEATAQFIRRVSGPTFADMTRVAASNPALWTELLLLNKSAVAQTLRSCSGQIENILKAIEHGDSNALTEILAKAQRGRLAWQQDER